MADSLGHQKEGIVIAQSQSSEFVELPTSNVPKEMVDAMGEGFGGKKVLGL